MASICSCCIEMEAEAEAPASATVAPASAAEVPASAILSSRPTFLLLDLLRKPERATPEMKS